MSKKGKKKTNLIKLILLLVIVAGALVFGYLKFFAGNDEPSKKNKPNKPKPVQKEEIKIVNTESTSRPYAIMINNLYAARPYHSGLQDAYIIYEIIVEGGITRYLALFLDADTSRIGPVRSSRHYYLDYALENDAIYVHNGYSPQAGNDFGKLGIDRIEAEAPKTGIRDKSLPVAREHTLFTSTELLKNGIGKKRTERKNPLLLTYSSKPINLNEKANNQVANKITIKYSNNTTTSYEYDPEAKVYKRFVNGKEHKDYVTKNQYTFKNIITYQVKNNDISSPDGYKGRQEIHNIGTGTGYYISEGYAVPIKWEKSSRSAQTKYSFEDGTPLKVNDGNTFIQIQPQGQTFSIEE